MINKSYLLLFLAAGMLVVSATANAQGYVYESVEYPGASSTNLFGTNHRGHSVGFGFISPDNLPFVYDTRRGTLTPIAPVGGSSTRILGISDKSDIVGSVTDASTLVESGLILDRNGIATVFNHPDANNVTQARSVNNRGQITAIRRTSDPFQIFASFVYDATTGTITDIVPSVATIAQGINNRGDVVGSAVFVSGTPYIDPCDSGVPNARYGWLRTTDGNVTYFSVNGMRTSARDISDSGTIVGFISDPLTSETKGFVTKLDGTQCQAITIADEDLVQFPGALFSFAQSITSTGAIVGTYDLDGFGSGGGFIATPR